MTVQLVHDRDFLSARLHGRRSRMAVGERLDALCQLPGLPELAGAIHLGGVERAADLQRGMGQALLRELLELRAHVSGAGARLFDWLLARFQLDNLKVLACGMTAGLPLSSVHDCLVPLLTPQALDSLALLTATSIPEFAQHIPEPVLRQAVLELTVPPDPRSTPFFLEAALQQAYFRELLARVDALSGEDRRLIRAVAAQEADVFHVVLVARGGFLSHLDGRWLLALHVPGTAISRQRFAAMLAAPDLAAAARRIPGVVLDGGPAVANASTLQSLAEKRFLRLANRAFRGSHRGLAFLAGYVALRRGEVANLVTLSEGIRRGISGEAIRARLGARAEMGALHGR